MYSPDIMFDEFSPGAERSVTTIGKGIAYEVNDSLTIADQYLVASPAYRYLRFGDRRPQNACTMGIRFVVEIR